MPRQGDALLLRVLLMAGEHFCAISKIASTGSCDAEAAGTQMSMSVAQAYRTRLELC